MNRESSLYRDVRMRGFSSRSTVEEAWAWGDQLTNPLAAEEIEIAEACGRVLTADVVSEIDVPAFRRASMDGYALQGEQTVGAGDYNRLAFQLVGESLPGRAFEGVVQTGQAVRIMTGAPVPEGADAVVPAEYAAEREEQVDISLTVSPRKNVADPGEDVQRGVTVLSSGRRLRPQDVGLLASIGKSVISVVRRPRVRILTTGDEVVSPGSMRGPHQIFDANSFLLRGLIKRDGGVIESCRALKDDRAVIRQAMTDEGADVVIVTGGSSVGAEDHAPLLLAEVGELAIHGIAMRPSSPTGMGRIGETILFLLPGNPVSCLCAYDFFAGRAIRRLGRRSGGWPYASQVLPVGRKIVSAIGRVDYVRVKVEENEVVPLAVSGASVLSSTTRADGFVIVPAESEGLAPGQSAQLFLYDPPA